MSKGQFIVVYGMNNLGKTTVATSLVEKLKAQDVNTNYLKYPIYEIESGKRLNAYLREGNPQCLNAEQAQALFAQNRRDYEEELIQRLEMGMTVVAEDYLGTGMAWGMTFGVSFGILQELNKGLLKPDIAILLDGERFITGHEGNHKHEGISPEQWQNGREIHQMLARLYDWETVSANQTREKVLSDLLEIVSPGIGEGKTRRVEAN